MNESSKRILYNRYEWIANKLQREAYLMQMKGRDRPLRQFIPCEKGLVFTSAMGNAAGVVSGLVISMAAKTICTCHAGLGQAELDDLFGQSIKIYPTPVKTQKEPQP